jgi:hypothetical protein
LRSQIDCLVSFGWKALSCRVDKVAKANWKSEAKLWNCGLLGDLNICHWGIVDRPVEVWEAEFRQIQNEDNRAVGRVLER